MSIFNTIDKMAIINGVIWDAKLTTADAVEIKDRLEAQAAALALAREALELPIGYGKRCTCDYSYNIIALVHAPDCKRQRALEAIAGLESET